MMLKRLLALLVVATAPSCGCSGEQAEAVPKSAGASSHREVAAIGTTPRTRLKRLTTFCMDRKGNLLACDAQASVIKLVDPEGKLLATWTPPVAPQAISATEDGTIYLGGAGKLAKLDESGKTLKTAKIEGTSARTPRIAAISATKKDLFVSLRDRTSYAVYRFDLDFGGGRRIVSGLRGCCGQMDIKARGDVLYVAENARHRLVRYDRDGKLLSRWGKADRKGLKGFASCCNPMNICFGPDGMLYTCEAGIGRIKRHSPDDGKLLGVVGSCRALVGCRHVAVAVSKDARRVYVADTYKKIIRVLAGSAPAAATTSASVQKPSGNARK